MVTYSFLQEHVPAPGATYSLDWALIAFPALRLLAVTPQDPYFHPEGNVWVHTIMVTSEVVNGADYAASTAAERFILFYAALLHDIAKYDTTIIDPVTGKIGQPGHSRRGAIDVRLLLWRANVPFDIREAICRIISVHQVPFFAIAGNKNGQSAEFIVRKLSHELDLRLLSAVAEADMRGRHYEKKEDCLVDIELFRQLAREEGCYGAPRQFADSHTRIAYFRGAGISPDYAHYAEPGSKVKMLSGLPAAGKDTLVNAIGSHMKVISLDNIRAELNLKHGVKAGAAIHLAIDRAKELLRAKEPFIWNATHISPLMRQKTLDLLYSYNADVELTYLEQPEEVIYRRNSKRDTTLTNAAIERMLTRWEPPLPTEANILHYHVT